MSNQSKKKVLIWTIGLDNFLRGSAKFNGGIAVQLTFWAKAFLTQGWSVYSFSDCAESALQGIEFRVYRSRKGLLALLLDCFVPLQFLYQIRPDVLVFRGASRNLFFVSMWARLFGVKLVFMGANDGDFVPGMEIINRAHDKLLYRCGLRLASLVVVQNPTQQSNLLCFYGKSNSIIIPNIWGGDRLEFKSNSEPEGFILWVGNISAIKRPKLFIDMAKRISDHRFLMIGGANDRLLYEDCESASESVSNLKFLGGLPFLETNTYFQKARVLVCTSQSEGFPNTFLQAWSNEVPVVTTFDPGGVIRANGLGLVADSLDELVSVTESLLHDAELYNSLVSNIHTYFRTHHDSSYALSRLTGILSK